MFKKIIVYALICLPLVLSGCTTSSKDSDVGLKTHQNENLPVDLKNLKSLAEQGDIEAQFNLGAMYYAGQGVSKDIKQAAYWFTKSAEQGNADAQMILGRMYGNGQGVPADSKQAIYWLTKSAKQGNTDAQFGLGLIYGVGLGVPKDYVVAYVWFNMGAINNDANAVKHRDIVLNAMTPEQVATAKEISKKCYNSNYKDCTP